MLFDTGVYTITSPSGEQYVGSSVDFRKRWNEHLRDLRKNRHHCLPLQRAYIKYGEQSLIFKKVVLCSKLDLIEQEQRLIDLLKPAYNVCKVAGNKLGCLHTEEAKAKNKADSKKRWEDPEYRARLSAAHKVRWTEEFKLKMSQAHKGKKPMLGKRHSQETKDRMSVSRQRHYLK